MRMLRSEFCDQISRVESRIVTDNSGQLSKSTTKRLHGQRLLSSHLETYTTDRGETIIHALHEHVTQLASLSHPGAYFPSHMQMEDNRTRERMRREQNTYLLTLDDDGTAHENLGSSSPCHGPRLPDVGGENAEHIMQ